MSYFRFVGLWRAYAGVRISVILAPMCICIPARQGFRLILGLVISFSVLAIATPVFGQTSEADFVACTARLKQEAQRAGISADVSNDVLDNVKRVERVITNVREVVAKFAA